MPVEIDDHVFPVSMIGGCFCCPPGISAHVRNVGVRVEALRLPSGFDNNPGDDRPYSTYTITSSANHSGDRTNTKLIPEGNPPPDNEKEEVLDSDNSFAGSSSFSHTGSISPSGDGFKTSIVGIHRLYEPTPQWRNFSASTTTSRTATTGSAWGPAPWTSGSGTASDTGHDREDIWTLDISGPEEGSAFTVATSYPGLSIQITAGSGTNQPSSRVWDGDTLVITLATDANGDPSSTADDVIGSINSTSVLSAWRQNGSDGLGLCATLSATAIDTHAVAADEPTIYPVAASDSGISSPSGEYWQADGPYGAGITITDTDTFTASGITAVKAKTYTSKGEAFVGFNPDKTLVTNANYSFNWNATATWGGLLAESSIPAKVKDIFDTAQSPGGLLDKAHSTLLPFLSDVIGLTTWTTVHAGSVVSQLGIVAGDAPNRTNHNFSAFYFSSQVAARSLRITYDTRESDVPGTDGPWTYHFGITRDVHPFVYRGRAYYGPLLLARTSGGGVQVGTLQIRVRSILPRT